MPRTRKATGQPTVFDVARAAGVSAITVSRALRTPDVVSATTRARVETAVRDLGYTPDPAAKALASDRSDIVGVIVPSVTNTVFSDTLRGIYEVAEASPLQIHIANSRYSEAAEERLLRGFLAGRPAALIVTGIDQSPATGDLLRRARCPVVQITETGPDPADMMVGFSHADAAAAAAQHLIARGYRRIAFLGAREDPRSHRRLAGFRAALEAAGLFDPGRVLFSPHPSSVPLGGVQFAELLDRDAEAEAVLCNNDDLALGALFECHRRGMAVPDRMGICGFNDIAAMAVACPSLTSVRTPRREIGRQAMRMILDRLTGLGVPEPVRDLGFDLVARESTARA